MTGFIESPGETIWSAPGRVTLIGDHTDYNAGLSLPFGLDRRTTASVRRNGGDEIEVISTRSGASPVRVAISALSSTAPPRIAGWGSYPVGMAWALARQAPGGIAGCVIKIDSEVPVGVGVSSSAALEMAVGSALKDAFELGLDAAQLATAGQLAENVAVGAPTGILDQLAVMYAERDHGVLIDFADLSRRPVELGFERAGLVILIIDSHTRHQHGSSGYAERRAECEEAVRVLGLATLRDLGVDDLPGVQARLPEPVFRRVRHVVSETGRTAQAEELLIAGRTHQLGEILTASHASMRDDYENSVPAIDAAVAAALDAGALGARLFGGGFGGACLALVRRDEHTEISARIGAAVRSAGFPEPVSTVVQPAAGPRQEEPEKAG